MFLTISGTRLRAPGVVGLVGMAGGLLSVLYNFFELYRAQEPLEYVVYSWLIVGRYSFDLGFRFDGLSGTLLGFVMILGLLIVSYATGCLESRVELRRLSVVLNLFVAAAALALMARSVIWSLAGWQCMSAALFLAIHPKRSQEGANGSNRALIMLRFADYLLIVGAIVLVGRYATADFTLLNEGMNRFAETSDTLVFGVPTHNNTPIFFGLSACLLLAGVCVKAVQIPFHSWLPQVSGASPIPISAFFYGVGLMVMGVYLVCRLCVLFDTVPGIGLGVAWLGGTTALTMALVAMTQHDIRRILAYSMASQMGLCVVALGLGAYFAALFHLISHALSAVCLYLGAGVAMSAAKGEPDIRKLGGMFSRVPLAATCFGLSVLSLSGCPPFVGFFSVLSILDAAYHEAQGLWVVMFLSIGATSFYLIRLYGLMFLGRFRGRLDVDEVTKELGVSYWRLVPMVILVVVCCVGGLGVVASLRKAETAAVLVESLFPYGTRFQYLPIYYGGTAAGMRTRLFAALAILVTSMNLLGYLMYRRGPSAALPKVYALTPVRLFHYAASQEFWLAKLIHHVLSYPLRMSSLLFVRGVEPWVVNGAFVLLPREIFYQLSTRFLKLHSGDIHLYAVCFLAGAALICFLVF